MKAVYLKVLVFPGALAAICLLEAFFVPLDRFTFRIWEAVWVNYFNQVLPGPFYPGMEIFKREGLDMNRSKIRENKWVTDIYGNRNTGIPAPGENYGIIVGDSNIAGASYSQEELFSEILSKQTKIRWYNLNYDYFRPWEHPMCRYKKPKVVVYQLKTGYLADLGSMNARRVYPLAVTGQTWFIRLDHSTKMGMINKLRGSLKLPPVVGRNLAKDPHLTWPLEILERIFVVNSYEKEGDPAELRQNTPAQLLEKYAAMCRSLGIHFIVLILPDSFRSADPIIRELSEKKVEIIAQLPTESYPDGVNLEEFWQKDDSHWSKAGMLQASGWVRDRLSPLVK